MRDVRPRGRASIHLFAAFAGFGAAWGGWGAALPAVQARASLTDRELGFALLAVALGALPAMRTAPRLVQRWPRGLLPSLTALLLAAFTVAAVARNLPTLAVALLVVGALSGAHDVAMNTVGAALEQHEARSRLQLAHATFSFAVVVAGVGVGAARQVQVPVPVALGALGFVVVAVTLLLWRAGPGPSVVVTLPRDPAPSSSGWRVVFVLGAIALVASLVENALQSWSALHLERSLEAPPFYGGLAAAAFALGAAAGRLVAHRFGSGRSLAALLATAASVAALSLIAAATATSPAFALVAISVAGAAVSTVLPAVLSEAGNGDGPGRGDIARVAMLGYLGFLVGPPLVGTIADLLSLRIAFGALSGIVSTIAILGWWSRRPGAGDAPAG